MRRWSASIILLACLIVGPLYGEEADSTNAEKEWDKASSFTIRVRHRVWENFREDTQVELHEEFPIGDSEYSAVLDRYVPDFAMKMQSKEIVSRTPEPNNPAVRIIVMENEEPEDTTWAFTTELPHYTRGSLLSFQIIRIDFEDREPIVVPDTLDTEETDQ